MPVSSKATQHGVRNGNTNGTSKGPLALPSATQIHPKGCLFPAITVRGHFDRQRQAAEMVGLVLGGLRIHSVWRGRNWERFAEKDCTMGAPGQILFTVLQHFAVFP